MQNHESSPGPVDAVKTRRPGVPAERAPEKAGNAHWTLPEPQVAWHEVLKDATRPSLTATFGSGQPPHALSGVLRRAAYQLPDYEVKRWALLLFADRVDSLEGRIATVARHPATWVLGLGALALMAGARGGRRRPWYGKLLFDL